MAMMLKNAILNDNLGRQSLFTVWLTFTVSALDREHCESESSHSVLKPISVTIALRPPAACSEPAQSLSATPAHRSSNLHISSDHFPL